MLLYVQSLLHNLNAVRD
ncbi:hypothetical protein CSUI_004528, partial [Cystoisospora suis]